MELTASFLKAFLGISEEKAQEILDSEDAEQQIKSLNADNLKKKFDEGHKKASKLTSKQLVDALKAEFDIDLSGETAQELAQSLKEQISDREAEDVSEETIKAHPAYKALQSDLTRKDQDFNKAVEKKVKEQVKEKEAQYQKDLKAAKRQGLMTEAEVEAERWLTENNAVLSTDPEKRKKQIKELARKLDSYDLEKDEDGSFLISKDGTPLTNKEGHNAALPDIFGEYDYLFNFQTTQQRQSTQLDPKNPGGNGQQKVFQHYKGEVPKTEQEYKALEIKAVNREISREAFKEVEAAWAEQNAK